MSGFDGYFLREARRRPRYLGQLAPPFQQALAANYVGNPETACDFTQVTALPDGRVIAATQGLGLDLRGAEDAYLGAVKFWGKRVIEYLPGSGWISGFIAVRAAELVVLDTPPLADDHRLAPGQPGADAVALRASAELLAERIRRGWWLTRKALGHEALAVYADPCDPPDDLGRFDVAVLAGTLSQLPHPYLALRHVAAMTDETIVITEPVRPDADGEPGTKPPLVRMVPHASGLRWYHPPGAVVHMLASLGFTDINAAGSAPPSATGQVPHFTVTASRPAGPRLSAARSAAPPADPPPVDPLPVDPAAVDRLPLPPPTARFLVSGTEDLYAFTVLGEAGYKAIIASLARAGVDSNALGRVLDFGCGVGRVLRYWAGRPAVEFYGTDLNADAIAWDRDNLPFKQFDVNGLEPKLNYPDGHFGLVYALSVFTHLPELIQRPWLRELARVTRSGGLVYFTTHGQSYRKNLTAEMQARFDRDGLVVTGAEDPGSNHCGAFHPVAYVQAEMLQPLGLTLLEFLPEGAAGNPTQDSWLVRKG